MRLARHRRLGALRLVAHVASEGAPAARAVALGEDVLQGLEAMRRDDGRLCRLLRLRVLRLAV